MDFIEYSVSSFIHEIAIRLSVLTYYTQPIYNVLRADGTFPLLIRTSAHAQFVFNCSIMKPHEIRSRTKRVHAKLDECRCCIKDEALDKLDIVRYRPLTLPSRVATKSLLATP